MNSRKVKVHYKERAVALDFDIIENIEHLRLAVNLTFEDLPPNYEILLGDRKGSPLTNYDFYLLKSNEVGETSLFISRKIKEDEADIESISSEISKISILDKEREMHQEFLNQKMPLRRLYEEQKKLMKEREKQFEFQFKQQSNVQNQKYPQIERESLVLNEDVQCNGCFSFPIEGVIYKCLVCQDYDLCSKCESTIHNFHPLLKITKKKHYPLHLKVAFSKRSQIQMEKLAELDRINQQKLKKIKYQKEAKGYQVIDPSTLPSKKVCQKNFISELVGSYD